MHWAACAVKAAGVYFRHVFHCIHNALCGNAALRISVRADRALADHVGIRAFFPDIPGCMDEDRRLRKSLEQKARYTVCKKAVYDAAALRVAQFLIVIEDRPHARKHQRLAVRGFLRARASGVYGAQHGFRIRTHRERVGPEGIRFDSLRTRRDIFPVRFYYALRVFRVIEFTLPDPAFVLLGKVGSHCAVEKQDFFLLKQVHWSLLFMSTPLYHNFSTRI